MILQRAYIGVRMMNKNGECGQDLSDHVDLRRRLFAAAEVHHHPRHVAQKWQRNGGTDERNERLYDAERHNIVTTVGTVTW